MQISTSVTIFSFIIMVKLETFSELKVAQTSNVVKSNDLLEIWFCATCSIVQKRYLYFLFIVVPYEFSTVWLYKTLEIQTASIFMERSKLRVPGGSFEG